MCHLYTIEAIEKISKETLMYHSAFKKNSYIDETGKEIIFTSGHCYDDPGQVYSPGEQIKVYVEGNTYENYLVDLEKFKSLGLG